VGRAYDDDLMAVDWDYMPIVPVCVDDKHADFPVGIDESVREARSQYKVRMCLSARYPRSWARL